MANEKLFKKNFVKWFKTFYPMDHINLIESEATTTGIPDISACKGGKEIWVELKDGYLSKNSIKPGQFVWHIKRNQAGGTTWIVQKYDEIIKVYNGKRIREFRESPNKVIPCKVFDGTTPAGRLELFTFLFN